VLPWPRPILTQQLFSKKYCPPQRLLAEHFSRLKLSTADLSSKPLHGKPKVVSQRCLPWPKVLRAVTYCSEIRNLAGRDPNTWIVGDELWDLIENNLQPVVNCAASGDVILFNATSPIKPVGRTEVAKNLTFGGYTDYSNGDSRSDVYATLRCPSDEGLFLLKCDRLALIQS